MKIELIHTADQNDKVWEHFFVKKKIESHFLSTTFFRYLQSKTDQNFRNQFLQNLRNGLGIRQKQRGINFEMTKIFFGYVDLQLIPLFYFKIILRRSSVAFPFTKLFDPG